MRIGVLTRSAGIPSSRIRFYEAEGILQSPDRTESGYRDYDDKALEDLILIGRAQELGYTLKEIALYLKADGRESRADLLRNCIDNRMSKVNGQMSRLAAQQASLRALRRQFES